MTWSPVFQNRKPATGPRLVPREIPIARNATGKRQPIEMSTRGKQKPTASSVSQRQNGENDPKETGRTQGSAARTGTKRTTSRKKIV